MKQDPKMRVFEHTRNFVRVLILLELMQREDGFPFMLNLEMCHYITIMDIRTYCADWSRS